MRKLLLVCITFLLVNVTYGQTNDYHRSTIVSIKQSGLTTSNPNPVVFVVVDSVKMKIDKISDYNIEPLWIESTIVAKDPTSKKIYGNENGVIFIYTKKKYKNEVLKEIEKNGAS